MSYVLPIIGLAALLHLAVASAHAGAFIQWFTSFSLPFFIWWLGFVVVDLIVYRCVGAVLSADLLAVPLL